MQKEIGKRLRQLRTDRKYSQQYVAKELGVSDTSYQKYEYGERDMSGDVLRRCAKLYGVTVDSILGITPFDKGVNQIFVTDAAFVSVPLYGAVAGGIPIEMLEDKEMKEAPARFIEDDPDCFMVRIKGNSENRRHIHDGDYALISPKYKEPTKGDLFLVAVNGDEATLKEVEVLENGIELIPDSYDPTYTRQVYDYNDPATPPITILGKYVWHCAPF